ncbi:MAG: hypothetical protein ACYSSJ_05435 [Planctomycetota bacterium]|jgi:hypothetical protein
MKLRATIFWVLLLQCALFADFSSECLQFSDPNDYIDDPNMQNGLFECGDANLTQYGFEPPIYWERIPHPGSDNQDDCYASLHYSSFLPENARWEISKPFEGDSFVLLSTGGFGNVGADTVEGAKISQEIFLDVEDTVLGTYFFGTEDYSPYIDWATIYIQPKENDDPNERILLAYCDVDIVGSYLSTLGHPESITGGWVPFSYTIIDANYAGSYYLQCEVVDTTDKKISSYLAVDGLRVCSGKKPAGDINHDCAVNLIDYSIFSSAWLAFCPDDTTGIDPNTISEPNVPCQLSDFDNNSYVDLNDLITMTDPNNWLINLPPQ